MSAVKFESKYSESNDNNDNTNNDDTQDENDESTLNSNIKKRSSANTNTSSSSTSSSDSPIIKSCDMPDEMRDFAISSVSEAMVKFQNEGEKKNYHNYIAKHVKKLFDQTYSPVWHCIVGRNFGSFVVHESKCFVYFYHGQVAVLLFKAGSSQFQ